MRNYNAAENFCMNSASDLVPVSLNATGRAQCPDCGAPLDLADQAVLDCRYCGGSAYIERRLRTVEARVDGGVETAIGPIDRNAGSTLAAGAWTPTHALKAVEQSSAQCPTCGGPVALADGDGPQQLAQCKQCGTRLKVERRLRRRGVSGVQALEELASAEKDDDYDQRRAGQTIALIDSIVAETDLAKRVALARQFESWGHINTACAAHLPKLLNVLKRCQPELEIPLSQAIGKLLCEGDARLQNAVLRAGDAFTFDIDGSQELLLELGLGSGVCCKLLLDTAEYAADQTANPKAIDYACTALWGISRIFERFYEHRDVCAQIILYRLLYMRGPVQAWALQLAQGQMGLGYRYPAPVLMRFLDDCAYERPELIPHIDKCFYLGAAANEQEYIQRVDLVDQLLTDPAKAAGLRYLYDPPQGAAEATVQKVLDRLLAFAKNPALADDAAKAIICIVQSEPKVRDCVHAMIKTDGDSLHEDIRRAYVDRVGPTPLLSKLPDRYWQPERPGPKSGFGQQLQEWTTMWHDALVRSVKAHDQRQEIAREYWRKLGH
jgi:hypothetical protein